jgi:hypothetical protein
MQAADLRFLGADDGNRTRYKNRVDLQKRRIRLRETTRNDVKRPANTRKVLTASMLTASTRQQSRQVFSHDRLTSRRSRLSRTRCESLIMRVFIGLAVMPIAGRKFCRLTGKGCEATNSLQRANTSAGLLL